MRLTNLGGKVVIDENSEILQNFNLVSIFKIILSFSNEKIEIWKRHIYCEVEAEFESRLESP